MAGPKSGVGDELMNISDTTTPLTEFSVQKRGHAMLDTALNGCP